MAHKELLKDIVHRARVGQNRSQADFAEIAKLSQPQVSWLESGKLVDLRATDMIWLAQVCGVSVDWMFQAVLNSLQRDGFTRKKKNGGALFIPPMELGTVVVGPNGQTVMVDAQTVEARTANAEFVERDVATEADQVIASANGISTMWPAVKEVPIPIDDIPLADDDEGAID